MVRGPLNQVIEASYGILGDYKTAIIEMSAASGIILLKQEDLNPLIATSYGTGELILDAVKKGCSKIIIGIGGSATNDGGLGLLQALGFHFLDEKGRPVANGGQELKKIRSISIQNVKPEILNLELLVACDVDNPLVGPKGATKVYGPQKGARPEMLLELEEGMINYGQVIEKTFFKQVLDYPGAGAAGGMGAGLMGCLDGVLQSGFEIISNAIELESKVENGNFDYIFTGEGQINHQTLHGKLPFGVAKIGEKYGVPVIAIAGSIGAGMEAMYDHGLTAAFSIINGPMSLNEAISNAEDLLYQSYFNLASLIKNKRP
jgi:glycerate kinase